MMSYSAQRAIAAEPAAIWAFLTDPRALVTADTGITRIEGTIGQGSRFKLWSEATGSRAFAITVTRFVAPREMTWQSGMPLGLFRGVRRFVLEPAGGTTRLTMSEQFSGLMAGPITRSMPDLQPYFERFVEAAKHHAELRKQAA